MLPQARPLAAPKPDPQRSRAALTKATLKAAELLAVPQGQLGDIIGLSGASISRMKAGSYQLDPARKEWELAALWVRLFRSLDSITGGRDDASRAWLHSANTVLGGRPADLIRDITGLVHAVEYLDASRARV
jgi:hypothetical protein